MSNPEVKAEQKVAAAAPKLPPISDFRWDEREQKLVRTHHTEVKGKNGTTITDTKQIYDKEAAKALHGNFKSQIKNIGTWLEQKEKIKALAADPSKIPHFEEVKQVLDILQWQQDQRIQQQYAQGKFDIQVVTNEMEALKKVIPANL